MCVRWLWNTWANRIFFTRARTLSALQNMNSLYCKSPNTTKQTTNGLTIIAIIIITMTLDEKQKQLTNVNNKTKAISWNGPREMNGKEEEKTVQPTNHYIWASPWDVIRTPNKSSLCFFFCFFRLCSMPTIAWKFTHFTFNRLKWVLILDVWTNRTKHT